jgi:hypothetical protein
MSKLNELLKSIKKSFTLQKKVEFEDLQISIILEPLTAMEELKVLEACKDFEGGSYIESLKKSSLAYSIKQINDIVFNDLEVDYEDDKGNPVKESKYLFLLHQVENWPAAIRDVLFDAFNNLHSELEARVSSKAKFERFTAQQPVEELAKQDAGAPEGFRKLENEEEPEDEVAMLEKRVKEEQEQAQTEIDKSR